MRVTTSLQDRLSVVMYYPDDFYNRDFMETMQHNDRPKSDAKHEAADCQPEISHSDGASAEMDNMRRRMDKERSDLFQYSLDKIMNDLLPLLDAFDKASDSAGQEGADSQSVLEGMSLLHKQLFGTLEKHGLKPIDATGE